MTSLDAGKIKSYLQHDFCVEVIDEVTSTNLVLKGLAEKNAVEGAMLVANNQTNGRGRLDRQFFSPKDAGVYFSFVVKPTGDICDMLTIIAALSVYTTIKKYSTKSIGIKWVNDIYADNKKCAGVLAEGSRNIDNSTLKYAIVGIGVNIYEPPAGYPEDIKNIATSILTNGQNVEDIHNKIVAEIINTFFDLYHNFDKQSILLKYKQSMFILGKKIVVCNNQQETIATAVDIDNDGRLIVQFEDESIHHLNSGDVRLKI